MIHTRILPICLSLLLVVSAAHAVGGKWTPEQLLDHDPEWLKELGLEVPAQELWSPGEGELGIPPPGLLAPPAAVEPLPQLEVRNLDAVALSGPEDVGRAREDGLPPLQLLGAIAELLGHAVQLGRAALDDLAASHLGPFGLLAPLSLCAFGPLAALHLLPLGLLAALHVLAFGPLAALHVLAKGLLVPFHLLADQPLALLHQLAEAFEVGAEAALVASIVHEDPERLPKLKRELQEAGWPIRS